MRLINVHTRLLEEFIGDGIPEYAILSHTWEGEEVTYSHYVKGDYKHMKGFYKIDMTCQVAENAGLSYAWVDTCCIDKSSSAELSEAINSMFQWYERARECYAYLSDLDPGTNWTEKLPECRWFTRGWTLQELIAPRQLIFFDSAWSTAIEAQERTKEHLARLLSDITGVDETLLAHHRSVRDQSFCVAKKISWAAHRKTTRLEDEAYCLLGLLEINIPLLYGEGHRAFLRLQEEIMRSKADLSIFAWQLPTSVLAPRMLHPRPGDPHSSTMITGVLARSPADFIHARDIISVAGHPSREFSSTNIGIRIHAPLYFDDHENVLLLPLNCTRDESMNNLSLRLLYLGNRCYLRLDPFSLHPKNPDTWQVNVSADKYLLPDHSTVSHSHKRWELLSNVKAQTRTAFFQVQHPFGSSSTQSLWPRDCYDRVEEVFFVGSYQPQDMCCIDIVIDLRSVILIATGWSDATANLQFGILPAEDYKESIKKMQDQALEFHYDRKTFLLFLKSMRIPRKTFLHHGSLDTVVRARSRWHPSNERKSRAPGWSVALSVEAYSPKFAPAIEDLDWVTE